MTVVGNGVMLSLYTSPPPCSNYRFQRSLGLPEKSCFNPLISLRSPKTFPRLTDLSLPRSALHLPISCPEEVK